MASSTTKAPAAETLRATIENMDALSQEGFGQIAGIARIALRSLESPEGSRDTESIAQALRAILGRAEDIEDCINTAAGDVGCAWVDLDAQRRRAAKPAQEVVHG